MLIDPQITHIAAEISAIQKCTAESNLNHTSLLVTSFTCGISVLFNEGGQIITTHSREVT